MKHVFIVNPAAGKGRGVRLIPEIEELFEKGQEECVIQITERPGHAEEIARRHASKDQCRIYSVGGDGTLNEVLNGMAGTNSSLGIIPCGSGNDFVRSLSGTWNQENILKRTLEGEEKVVDIAKINGRFFINIASVGFDSEVVYNSRKLKRTPGITGSMAYILGIVMTVFRFDGCRFHINIDGKDIDKRLLLAAVGNGRYYGGGMMPVPEAKPDDGYLDICLIDAIQRIKILAFFPRMIKGTHGGMKEVSFYKGRRIEIKADKEFSINIDGEILRGCEAVFEIVPSAVSVVIPS